MERNDAHNFADYKALNEKVNTNEFYYKAATSTRPIWDYKFILGFAAAAFYLMETFISEY